MKGKILVLAMSLLLMVSGVVVAVGGETIEEKESIEERIEENNENEEVTEIHDWYDLDGIREDLNGTYNLMSDLDDDTEGYDELVDTEDGWEPIGDDDFNFSGTFDGNEHEISDLYINRSDTNYVGLFGYVGMEGKVSNVGVVDADVSGNIRVGGLVGYNDGTVENSYATGDVSGDRDVGGLMGYNDGTVENSYAKGNVIGVAEDWTYVGGLVGTNSGTVENLYATGQVSGYEYVGGLVGANSGTVENSYAKGTVNGDRYVGGLVGYNDGPVNNSHAVGEVSGSSRVGALVGYNGGSVSNSYAAGEVSGSSSVGGLVGRNSGPVNNSHYNIDEVLINGGNHITIGGLFDAQYQDWIENKDLDISDYSDTLVPVGDHYEISCVDGLRDLLGFAGDEGYHFRLTEDIDISYEPGLYIPYLSADFEGAGHTLSDLYIDIPFASGVGMFGYVRGGVVTNLGVVDADVSGSGSVGGLVGSNNGVVENSYATGEMSSSGSVGGLVGGNSGEVENSYATGQVSGDEYVGGLVGLNSGTVGNSYATNDVIGEESVGGLVGASIGTVSNSYSTGQVSGDDEIGGLVGLHFGTVSNSYSTGQVSGDDEIGGLVGLHFGTVSNSYATGDVSGNNTVGGLVGEIPHGYGTVSNSFWDIETTGQNESDGGTGKTTTEMKDVATYTDTGTEGLDDPWDFVGDPNDDEGDEDIWDIDEDEELNDGYPFLSWEIRNELRIQIGGNGTVEVDGEEVEDGWTELYDDGTEVDITAVPEEGHEFHGWIGDHTGDEKDITITVDSDKVIIAYFEEEVPEYDLTIDLEGEGSTEPSEGTHTYEEGEIVTVTAAAADGWSFEEWTGDVENTEDEITVTMDSDKNITAVFEELSYYTLTVNVEGEGIVEIDPDKEEYEEGTKVTLTAIADENWYFDQWTGDHEGTEAEITVTMDGDKEITAHFAIREYTLTVNVEGEGIVETDPDKEEYEEGTKVTLTAIADENWYFDQWTGDHEGTEDEITVTMDGDKEIIAHFAIREYTLTMNVEGEGTTEPEEGTHTYEEGTVVTVEATPDEGWHFVEWTGDKTCTGPMLEITMDADKTITANFEEVVEYDLMIATEGKGSVEVDGEKVEDGWTSTYEEGTEVELKAMPDEGYVFKEWTGVYEGESDGITVVMDENKTITAHFEEESVAEFFVSGFNVSVDGLEITITADIENVGNAEGTIDLIVEGEVVESFALGSGDVDTIETAHGFDEEGEYSVELGDESETVTVEEEKEDEGIGMTTMIGVVVIIVIVLVIVVGYIMKGGRGTDTAAEEEYGEEETEENMFRDDTYSDL